MVQSGAAKYDMPTIIFHGVTAVLVIGLWVVGQTADWVPKGPGRGTVWSFHVVFGFLLALVVLGRIVWRLTAGRKLPGLGAGWLRFLAKAGHYLLYLVLIVVVALGVANAFVRGFHIFDIVTLPQLIDPDQKKRIGALHSLGANLLIILVAGHAVVGLAHQFVLRDGALDRIRA